jgi:hypothetical protein
LASRWLTAPLAQSFRDEIDIMAQMNHPNIAKCFDVSALLPVAR